MPPRRRPAAQPAVTEPEEANGSRSKLDNLQKYLEKDLTPTMQDYFEWFGANVTDPEDLASDRLIALAVNFYSEFQASDFNKERKEERRTMRASAADANGETEPEPEPATRGRRGARGAAKPAAGKPAAGRGRGKPAAKPASSKAAVY